MRLRGFIRFKNPAQAARYSSEVDIFPRSLSAPEHFTDGVEPSDDHNKQPEIEKNCVHPRIVSLKKNRGHEPHPKGDSNDPQTTCSAIRHEPFWIVALCALTTSLDLSGYLCHLAAIVGKKSPSHSCPERADVELNRKNSKFEC